LLVAKLVEDLIEALGRTAPITAGHRLWLSRAARAAGAPTAVSVTVPIPIATSPIATATITAVASAVVTTSLATATLLWWLGVGQRGAFERLDQLETDFAPIDLTNTNLELLSVAQVVLHSFDSLRAVET